VPLIFLTNNWGGNTMSRSARKDNDTNIIKNVNEAPIERKDTFLKRVKKEERANKKTYAKSGTYITLSGYKVLIKYKNATGSEYSRYWFNAKRYPEKMALIKANKGSEIDGVFVELKK